MVYIYDMPETEKLCPEKYTALMSKQRLDKMNRYRFCKDKNLCLMAFLLLRYALFKEFSITDMPTISEKEKPTLENIKLCFNLSHCDNAIACVIDEYEVGIDIQNYLEKIWEVRSMFLTNSESERLLSEDHHSVTELTRIWTMKEAYGKFYGQGLCYQLCETSFEGIKSSNKWQEFGTIRIFSKEYDDYALSVCSERNIDIQFVSKEELTSFAEKFLQNK